MKLKQMNRESQNFELLIDGVPYLVRATPYPFNTETRFLVSYSGSDEHVFAWDSSLGRLAAIDDNAADIPDNLEEAIAEKLQSTIA